MTKHIQPPIQKKEAQIEVLDYEYSEGLVFAQFDADAELFKMQVDTNAFFEIIKGLGFIEDFLFYGDGMVMIDDNGGKRYPKFIADFVSDILLEVIEEVVPIAFRLSVGNEVDREGIHIWQASDNEIEQELIHELL